MIPTNIEEVFRQDQEAEDKQTLQHAVENAKAFLQGRVTGGGIMVSNPNAIKIIPHHVPITDALARGGVHFQEQQRQPVRANDKQISGTHYKQFKGYEPWDVITAWGLDYLTGSAVKYLARWKHKGGVDDIKKAIHFLEKLVEEEEKKRGVRHTAGPIEAY